MILLTGFEPFGGEATNPSWTAARRAADRLASEGYEAAAVELPCSFAEAPVALAAALEQFQPRLVLCAGQAGGRSAISLERVAINVIDARLPDNRGERPVDRPVRGGGPAAYFTTLPIKAALENLTGAGIPVEVSQTAGTYVCNATFYALMDLLASREGITGGFVHVPYSTGQGAVHGKPGLDVGQMAFALALIAVTALENPVDIEVPAGAEH
ncbi:pyroglutamyl-peptidase I [Arthrobacter sp. TMN-37]